METKEFKNLSVGTVVEFNFNSGPMIICGRDSKSILCNSIDENGKYFLLHYYEDDSKNLYVIPEDSWMVEGLMNNIRKFGYRVIDGVILESNGSRIKMGFLAKFLNLVTSNKGLDKFLIFLFFFVVNFFFFGIFVHAFDCLKFFGSWWYGTLIVTVIGYIPSVLYMAVWKGYLKPRMDKKLSSK